MTVPDILENLIEDLDHDDPKNHKTLIHVYSALYLIYKKRAEFAENGTELRGWDQWHRTGKVPEGALSFEDFVE